VKQKKERRKELCEKYRRMQENLKSEDTENQCKKKEVQSKLNAIISIKCCEESERKTTRKTMVENRKVIDNKFDHNNV
jgi:hypothetical protein